MVFEQKVEAGDDRFGKNPAQTHARLRSIVSIATTRHAGGEDRFIPYQWLAKSRLGLNRGSDFGGWPLGDQTDHAGTNLVEEPSR